MQEWIVQFLTFHPTLVYIFFAFFSCVEGPVLSMIGGILLHQGYLSFFPVYISLIVGDLIGDTVWYTVGRHFGPTFVGRFGEYFSITDKNIAAVEKIFRKYESPILIISKMTMGFGFAIATLFTAGLVRIPYRKYILLNLVGQFVWTGALLAVGYLFGQAYESVSGVLGKVSLIAMLILAFLALFGYGRYIKRRLTS